MAERNVDGRRLGTAADAGALCVTVEKPTGVNARRYHDYVKRSHAPGPVTRDGVVLTDPSTGGYLFDLDDVEKWNAQRPGRGYRRTSTGTLRRTDLRVETLAAAVAGKLTLEVPGRIAWEGQRPAKGRNWAVKALTSHRLITLPEQPGRKVRATQAGRRQLAEWQG